MPKSKGGIIKGRNLDSQLGVKRIDSMELYSIPRPQRIASRTIRKFPAKNSPFKTVHCSSCGTPALWYDERIREQFNKCLHCDTVHQMLIKGGVVSKRAVEVFPKGYEEPLGKSYRDKTHRG